MWKKLRIAILLFILLSVVAANWRGQQGARDWQQTIQISIFPLNGDGRSITAAHIAALKPADFADIEAFLSTEAQRYGLTNTRPVRVTLQPAIGSLLPPAPHKGGAWEAVQWSLQLRYWAWRQPAGVPRANIRAFVIYHDSEADGGTVPASHGLAKGQLAMAHVHIARRMQKTNNVVIAHEILHTMGATDKYDLSTLAPRYPQGYAEPNKQPRLPQTFCELMAGRIPLSEQYNEMPYSLKDCRVGELSAQEIGWRH